MWDERYSAKEYAYGKEPNGFLEQHVLQIPKGKILSLAEGEGRNAVFLAKMGYQVTAVDSSIIGLRKAEMLAKECEVDVDFVHADLAEYTIGYNLWDGIISIFCPLPSALRKVIHKNVVGGLKTNGVYLLQAYTPAQLNYGTGGGNSADVMQSKTTLSEELMGLEFAYLRERERKVVEGIYHTGLASVVEAIALKPGKTS